MVADPIREPAVPEPWSAEQIAQLVGIVAPTLADLDPNHALDGIVAVAFDPANRAEARRYLTNMLTALGAWSVLRIARRERVEAHTRHQAAIDQADDDYTRQVLKRLLVTDEWVISDLNGQLAAMESALDQATLVFTPGRSRR